MMVLRLLWATAAGHQLLMAQTNIISVQAASSIPFDNVEGQWVQYLEAKGCPWHWQVVTREFPGGDGFEMLGRLNSGIAAMKSQGYRDITLVAISPEGEESRLNMNEEEEQGLQPTTDELREQLMEQLLERHPEEQLLKAELERRRKLEKSKQNAGAASSEGAKSETRSIGKVEEQKPKEKAGAASSERQDKRKNKKQGIFGFASGFLEEPGAKAKPAAKSKKVRFAPENKVESGAPADANHAGYPGSSSRIGTGGQKRAATSKSELLVGGREDVTIDEDMNKMFAKLMLAGSNSD
ncbi:unnamed protein product [Amoebophrya sp. A120]|nr:unnamed protein product [Amoebophrya sp. A120]|eukprot:GSA120T00005802001.1